VVFDVGAGTVGTEPKGVALVQVATTTLAEEITDA